MEPFGVASFLAVVNKAIVDYVAAPVRQKYQQADLWWLVYVALVSGGVIGWLSGVNVFGEYIPDPLVGRFLTSVLVGGGSSLIHDIFDR
jgi:hypothetical protein